VSNPDVALRALGNLCKHIAQGLAITAGFFVLEIGLAALSYLPFASLGYVPDEYDWFVATVMILGNLIIFALIIAYRWRSRNRRLKAEAEKWLRFKSQATADTQRYAKLEGRVFWTPTVVTFIAFLFLPELAGILSHCATGRSANLNGYRIDIPLTWTITHKSAESVQVLFSKGIARIGVRPYLRGEEPLESVLFSVGSINNDLLLAHSKLLSTENLGSKTHTFTCFDLAPLYDVAHHSWSSRYAVVTCIAQTGDFYASFEGDRSDLQSFYDVLESTEN
jgi:hypothetical protein